MPFQVGNKKSVGLGRPKGSKNRQTKQIEQRAIDLGIDPFDTLLLFAGGDWKRLGYGSEKIIVKGRNFTNEVYTIDPAVRARAAAEASQYLYPKRKAVDLKVDEGTLESLAKMSEDQLIQKAKLLQQKLGLI